MRWQPYFSFTAAIGAALQQIDLEFTTWNKSEWRQERSDHVHALRQHVILASCWWIFIFTLIGSCSITSWPHEYAAVSKTLWKSSFSPEKKVLVCTKGISSRFRVGIYERDPKQLLDGGSLINGENTVVKTFGNHGEITPLQYIMHVSIVTRYYAHIKFSKRNVSAHWEHVRVQSCLWNIYQLPHWLLHDVINEQQLLKPVLKNIFSR